MVPPFSGILREDVIRELGEDVGLVVHVEQVVVAETRVYEEVFQSQKGEVPWHDERGGRAHRAEGQLEFPQLGEVFEIRIRVIL